MSEEERTRQGFRKAERHGREHSHSPKSPMARSGNTRTSDSGVGKSCRTSGSSAVGDGRNQRSRSEERKWKAKEDRRTKKGRKEEPKEEVHLKQTNLLNKMVNQTREHRKQIKTLESELERLRTTGDALSTCEVSQRDVEWRPGDVVGEGSFSIVYKGNYCGTEVAVKELKFKLSQDDKNYFRSEAALLQQLHHPRVVLLMGVCTTSTRPFMLLEYLSGGTLHGLIHSTTRERLDHAAYFSVAKDVALGLNYLHKHDPQVLHLDLKSMNVLLDSYTRAKIADFGFSILRRSRGAGSAVQRGSIRGTPAWMAPELLTKGDVSPKCDVYSYSIILWEMLTASHPFQGLDIYRIMEAVEEGGRPPLPHTGVSQELRELITSCWAQNPSLRPSFEEILGALETASLPTSWRKVLTKANIGPSALTDVTTARAIIDMIERSAELFESNIRQYKRSRKEDKENVDTEDEKYRRRTSKKNTVHESLGMSSRGKALSPRGRKLRPSSSSREDSFVASSRPTRSSQMTKYERRSSPSRRVLSPRKEKKMEERRMLSPPRGGVSEVDSVVSKIRPSREGRRRSKTRSPLRSEKREKEDRGYSRSPDKGRYTRETEGVWDRRTNLNSPYNKPHVNEEFSLDVRRLSEERPRNKGSPYRSPDPGNEFRRRKTESTAGSSDEVESHNSQAVYKKSSPRSISERSPASSPSRRSRARSPNPRRQSPIRQRYPPEKVDMDHKRIESGRPQRYGGIVLTAEQLLSQKQRLRPVRPSALKDLSLLPQSSLNDISLLLKQAMMQRRDALEQMQSIRGTTSSKEVDWPDWF